MKRLTTVQQPQTFLPASKIQPNELLARKYGPFGTVATLATVAVFSHYFLGGRLIPGGFSSETGFALVLLMTLTLFLAAFALLPQSPFYIFRGNLFFDRSAKITYPGSASYACRQPSAREIRREIRREEERQKRKDEKSKNKKNVAAKASSRSQVEMKKTMEV